MELFADGIPRGTMDCRKRDVRLQPLQPDHETVEIDLFVEEPFDFPKAYALAFRDDVVPGVAATFVSLEDLLWLKKQAGRPRDLADIEKLEAARAGRRMDKQVRLDGRPLAGRMAKPRAGPLRRLAKQPLWKKLLWLQEINRICPVHGPAPQTRCAIGRREDMNDSANVRPHARAAEHP